MCARACACAAPQVRSADTGAVAEVNGAAEQEDEDDEEDGMMPEEEVTRDVRYVLDDAELLGILFQVFSECQSLHPDEEMDGESEKK